MTIDSSLSSEAYRQAGVDLDSAARVVDIARAAARPTQQPWQLGGLGGFSGAFEIPAGYRQPVLLSGCDGVGTKLKIAFMANDHRTVGIDLVAMSVNDILVNGGKPLAFLDYVATGKILPDAFSQILSGISEGCQQAGCALLGGETAEMPGMYLNDEYDLAGFCIGIAEKDELYPHLDAMQVNDTLIGLPSAGLHSNGYSLVRKILFQDHALAMQTIPEGWTHSLKEELLQPTRIYVARVLSLLSALPTAVKGMVHVTGGGFYDNLPRALPARLSAEIDAGAWRLPPIFQYLQALGGLSNETLWHTFNCGVGYILIVDPTQAQAVLAHLNQDAATRDKAFIMGQLIASHNQRAEVLIS